MRSLAAELDAPPRLLRSVLLQALALCALCAATELPWPRRAPAQVVEKEPPKPQPQEKRIRVMRLDPPKPVKVEPVKKAEAPKVEPAKAEPPMARPARPEPQRAEQEKPTRPQPMAAPERAERTPPPREIARAEPEPKPAAPLAHIAADATAVHGVRLRVLVPRSPPELAAHLRNSGGCLVVSRLAPDGAEVLRVFDVQGFRAVEQAGPPCGGVPRLLRDAGLNDALGDPLGRTRASLPSDERDGNLVLQVLLTPQLQLEAQSALRARFGSVSAEEMSRLAAESGYELTCLADPGGSVRCH
jgi:hypothetical protein